MRRNSRLSLVLVFLVIVSTCTLLLSPLLWRHGQFTPLVILWIVNPVAWLVGGIYVAAHKR